MEQIYFGQRISALRKERGMTQEALAQKLGITNQAVSKWESDQCCPDIMQLPALADIFEISMDALFGRPEPERESAPAGPEYWVDGLPWENDDNLYAVCYKGHRLIQFRDIPASGSKGGFKFWFSSAAMERQLSWGAADVTLEFSGEVNNIYSDFSVSCVNCDVKGNVQAGDSVQCGNVLGHVNAGDSVTCGSVEGNVQAGDDVTVNGSVGGGVQAGADLECHGSIGGNVQCSGDLECGGPISGDVRTEGDLECSGDIGGSVYAAGDVECQGSIMGNVTAEGDVDFKSE